MHKTDAADKAFEASVALWGVVSMLSEGDDAVERQGIEYILRLILEKLDPAVRSLNDL